MARPAPQLTSLRWLLAAVAGLALSSLPFLRYVHLGSPAGAHADHAARHGGQLQMVGDHHLELMRRQGRVLVYLSDAFRRPIQPARGWIAPAGAPRQPLLWDGQRMWADEFPGARRLEVELILQDGDSVRWTFQAMDPS